MNWRGYADSMGNPIAVGDKVRFRGKVYTIKAFHDGAAIPCARIEFEEPPHTPERATEFSVDRI